MSRRTKIPAFPDPAKENLLEVARAIKQALDVREGRTGNSEDRFVSFRDLKDLQVLTDGETVAGDGTKLPGSNPNPGGKPIDFTAPPAPTGFVASGGYGIIFLRWNTPQAMYNNHAYTEIWRNTVDNIGTAIRVGTSIGSSFADPVGASATYYYWIRFVSEANVIGPWNSTSGTQATSAIDVEAILAALSESITESQLYISLRSRIELIDADPSVEGSVAWRIDQQAKSTLAAITRLEQTVSGANESLALQRSIATATFGNLYSAIAEERLARSDQYGTLAQSIETVRSIATGRNRIFFQTTQPVGTVAEPLRAGDLWYDTDDNNNGYRYDGASWVRYNAAANVYYQASAPTSSASSPLRVGDLWYDSDDQNKPYRWSGSQWVAIRDANPQALVTDLEQTKIGYCTIGGVASDQTSKATCEAAGGVWNVGLPLATAVKQVAVSNGVNSLTLEQRFTAQESTNGQLLGQYSVKIDNNGAVSGFGLASTSPTNTTDPSFSEFYVNADRFAITAPANATGATLPASGPYSGYVFYRTTDKQNYRWDGSQWLAFTPAVPFVVQTTPTTVNGITVPPGVYIDAANIKVGTITRAVIADATITTAQIALGTITEANITDGTITTAKIANEIKSTNWDTSGGTQGWQILKSGNATFNNVTARGTVYATSGSFGTGTQRININANNIASNNYAANSAGFRIGYDGNAEFNNVSLRGVTVYDNAGNVLLSSGNKIPWSSILSIPSGVYNSEISIGSNGVLSGGGGGQVTLGGLGAGSLATQNSVFIGTGDAGNVRLFNSTTGTYQTLNVGDFVNALSRINTGNIGTFISEGAIGSVYIGNAQIQNANIANASVSTLKIDGEATMVPVWNATARNNIYVNVNWSIDIVSVNYTVSGLDPGESIKVLAIGILQAYPGDAAESNLNLGVFAGGVNNTYVASSFAAYGISMSVTGSWLVGNGTHNASLRVFSTIADKPNCSFVGQIIIMAIKR